MCVLLILGVLVRGRVGCLLIGGHFSEGFVLKFLPDWLLRTYTKVSGLENGKKNFDCEYLENYASQEKN